MLNVVCGIMQAEPATLASLVGAFAPQAADGGLSKAARRALKPGAGAGAADGVLAPKTPPRALTEDDMWPLRQVQHSGSSSGPGRWHNTVTTVFDSTQAEVLIWCKSPCFCILSMSSEVPATCVGFCLCLAAANNTKAAATCHC